MVGTREHVLAKRLAGFSEFPHKCQGFIIHAPFFVASIPAPLTQPFPAPLAVPCLASPSFTLLCQGGESSLPEIENMLETFWKHFGNSCESALRTFLRMFWKHVGNILKQSAGTFCEHSENMFENIRGDVLRTTAGILRGHPMNIANALHCLHCLLTCLLACLLACLFALFVLFACLFVVCFFGPCSSKIRPPCFAQLSLIQIRLIWFGLTEPGLV